MRILVVTQHFVPERCAPAARWSQLARAWSAAGHQVEVVCSMPNHPAGRVPRWYRRRLYVGEVHEDGVRVHRAPLWARPNAGVVPRVLSQSSFALSAAAVIARRVQRPDVIVATSPPLFAAISAAALARLMGVPWVFDVRDLWPGVFRDMGVLDDGIALSTLEVLERGLYASAAHVVAVSPAFVDPIVAQGGDRQRISVVPNGADLQRWHPGPPEPAARRLLGAERTDDVVVLYAGNHGQAQGLEVVLDAAREIERTAGGVVVRFVLVGDGNQREALVQRAARMRLGDRVRFVDSVGPTALADLYRAADLCVVPLRPVDGLRRCIPSKLFEIMACARPVIASLTGEGARIVETSGAGLATPPGDARALAEAVTTLAADPDRRAAMARAARQHVETHYDRHRLAALYLETLEEVATREEG